MCKLALHLLGLSANLFDLPEKQSIGNGDQETRLGNLARRFHSQLTFLALPMPGWFKGVDFLPPKSDHPRVALWLERPLGVRAGV